MSLYRRRKKMFRGSRSSMMWILIISLVVVLIAAILGLGGGLINFIDKHANVLDSQYIPMDLDRRTLDELKERTKNIDQHKLEELKKRFLDRQTKP